MLLRPSLKTCAALLPLLALALLLLTAAVPGDTAHACLPCYCPDNPTLNCFGDYAVFTKVDDAGTCRVDIYYVAPTGGNLLMSWTAPELNNITVEAGTGATLIEATQNISFYKLESGEYQVSFGPNGENKMFVTNFSACPVRWVQELNYTVGQPPSLAMNRSYDPGIPDQLNPLSFPAQPPAQTSAPEVAPETAPETASETAPPQPEPTAVPPTATPIPPTLQPEGFAIIPESAPRHRGLLIDPLESLP